MRCRELWPRERKLKGFSAMQLIVELEAGTVYIVREWEIGGRLELGGAFWERIGTL